MILAVFAAWERTTKHPMLNLAFFRQRSFAAAIPAVAAVTFGLYGALFVLTQFMQFSLGYTPLQAGVRVLPAAAAVVVIAPTSALLVRAIGTKLTMAAGLALIAAGLWQISGATVTTTFAGTVLGMVLLGAGPAGHPDRHRLRHRLGARRATAAWRPRPAPRPSSSAARSASRSSAACSTPATRTR